MSRVLCMPPALWNLNLVQVSVALSVLLAVWTPDLRAGPLCHSVSCLPTLLDLVEVVMLGSLSPQVTVHLPLSQ